MSKSLRERLLVAGATCAVAACGGGGGGTGVRSTPPPPATKVCPDGSVIPAVQPCPTPPPPPASPPIFTEVTESKAFEVLGLEASRIGTSAEALARDNFSVRYDAANKNYFIDLPSTPEFLFESGREDESYWHGFAYTGSYSGIIVDVFKPRSTNPEIQLAYTSFATTSGYYTSQFGFVAFGQATPDSGVPLTGGATYNALIAGSTLDTGVPVTGDASFQFNFGTGTLSGHMDPILRYNGLRTNLGRYDFVNSVFGIGSTTFSGRLSNSGTANLGAFDGRFTGPAAQELMARWTAPYRNPSTQEWNEMFGVMVGRRQ